MATVYQINKGINRSVEFRGIKAQYLLFLAVGIVSLLLICAAAFVVGFPVIPVIVAVLATGYALVVAVQRYSRKYGERGLAKKLAQARMPQYLTASSRKVFIHINASNHEEK